MKLTPLDIHHKEFRHALRGYNEEEVDQFLDQVADEFERLFKENIDLSERLEALQNKVNDFEMQRQTINNTLMTAQRSADDIISRTNIEAEGIVAHANERAKEIVNDALAKKQQVRGELLRIKQAEEEFREKYRAMLEGNLRAINEVPLGDDVSALLGETEEPVDQPMDAPGPVYVPVEAFVPEEPVELMPAFEMPAPSAADLPAEPVPVLDMPPMPQVISEPVFEMAEPEFDIPASVPAQSTQPIATEGPATPPFVSAVSLGELEAPEIPDDVDLVEPSEFSLPRFETLGERETDIDIEEID